MSPGGMYGRIAVRWNDGPRDCGVALNWDAVGAVGEIVGAAAVLVTLVYLSAQIRSARLSQQTQMRNEAFRQMQEFSYYVMSDQSLAWSFHKGVEDPEALSPEQQAQFWQSAFAFLKLTENIYLHYLKGAVDEEAWAGLRAILTAYVTRPGLRTYWEERRPVFDPKFVALVDSAEATIKSGGQALGFDTTGGSTS